jgi:hypothetical protein
VATSALQIMDRTIKSLGDAVRERIPITDMELPKAMRRLIAELERREAKRDRERPTTKTQAKLTNEVPLQKVPTSRREAA